MLRPRAVLVRPRRARFAVWGFPLHRPHRQRNHERGVPRRNARLLLPHQRCGVSSYQKVHRSLVPRSLAHSRSARCPAHDWYGCATSARASIVDDAVAVHTAFARSTRTTMTSQEGFEWVWTFGCSSTTPRRCPCIKHRRVAGGWSVQACESTAAITLTAVDARFGHIFVAVCIPALVMAFFVHDEWFDF